MGFMVTILKGAFGSNKTNLRQVLANNVIKGVQNINGI